MTYMNNNNTLYLAFKDVHPSWALIGCALSLGLIAAFGIIFNFAVIFVTFRTKLLRGTVNYLLALCSFVEMLHQFGHFLFVYTAFSGQNFIEFNLATKIVFIPIWGLGGIYPTMVFIGIDRLIGIAFEELENKLKIRLYLATITIICIGFCFSLCVAMYQNMDLYGGKMGTGSFVDLLEGLTYQTVWLYLIIITVIIYLFVGLVARIKSTGLPSASSINLRVLRALFCIIFVNVGGYFICSFYILVIKQSISSPITAWFCQVISAIPLNIGAASNGPILYFTSAMYRQAFEKEFTFVFKRSAAQNQTVPQQQNINRPINLVSMNTTSLQQLRTLQYH